ncbi:MAG TPA: hypothetical protein VL359_11680, partial [bacterium]|nr:hypothetical protein [bacterium]
EYVMNVTEYDRILVVTADGTYRIMAPTEKAWMPGPILHASIWDAQKGAHFVLVYLDADRAAWAKRVHIERFITNKTYPLVKEGSVGIQFLTESKNPGKLELKMVPAKRQKVKAVTVDLNKVPACGLTARGTKLTSKPVQSAALVGAASALSGNGKLSAGASNGKPAASAEPEQAELFAASPAAAPTAKAPKAGKGPAKKARKAARPRKAAKHSKPAKPAKKADAGGLLNRAAQMRKNGK